jgi:glycerol-3-phosphate dehydrogenase
MMAPLSLAQREEHLEKLRNELWDVVIIGGGINGAGLLRDLALRNTTEKLGLKIALIEKAHFGSGTSSKNSQLVHGGLRYLKYLNISLVREALRERQILMRIAPHLVRAQPFLMPFRSRIVSWYYSAGLQAYDLLAGSHAIQKHRWVARHSLAEMAPRLNWRHAQSAAIFYDGVMEAARLVLENIRDAHRHGAIVANYVEVDRFLTNNRGRVVGLAAVDRLSGRELEINARVVVNAAGPWGDRLRSKMPSFRQSLRLVRGSHLIFPQLVSAGLALSFFRRDGRIVFAIPWGANGELTLVGTTEVLHDADPDRVEISGTEIDYLMDAVSEWLPEIRHLSPVGRYSSLRPLIDGEAGSLSSVSREARLWVGREGVVHIAGGKYTTYRAMASQAAKLVCKELKIRFNKSALTAINPLGAVADGLWKNGEDEKQRFAARYDLEIEQVDYFARLYGARLQELLQPSDSPRALQRLHPSLPAVFAQMLFAVRYEMAASLSDFTSISTYVRYYRQWQPQELRPLAEFMGKQLGWDEKKIAQEVEAEARRDAIAQKAF